MNCKFCDQPMVKPLTHTVSHITVYECFRCPTSVRFFYIGDSLEKYIVFLSKKGKNQNDELYATIFWPKENRAELGRVWHSRRDGPDYYEGFHFEKPMISFNSLPEVTPANIHEKFKMYMLFS